MYSPAWGHYSHSHHDSTIPVLDFIIIYNLDSGELYMPYLEYCPNFLYVSGCMFSLSCVIRENVTVSDCEKLGNSPRIALMLIMWLYIVFDIF